MRFALVTMVVGLAAACGDPGVRIDGVPPFQRAARPDNPVGDMFEFDAGDVVESFDSASGEFRVHFTRDGNHAVDTTDDDTNDVPDFVEEVALVYDQALTFYESLGFARPLPDGGVGGGTDRFDVYLVDFGGAGDGAFRVDTCTNDRCVGFMVQENDFAGYGYPNPVVGVRTVGSHELFHAVQAAYDSEQGGVLAEGTAVWATEMFAPELPDFEYFISSYLDAPEQAIDRGQGYGHAIFFKYLQERFGTEFILTLWQACENGAGGVGNPYWLDIIDGLLAAEGSSFDEAFVEFAIWNLHTSNRADPAHYENGADYPLVARTSVTPPHLASVRSFYGSAQYWSARVEERTAMTAALVAADAGELDDLEVLLVVDGTSGFGAPTQLVDPSAGTETVDTTGAHRLLVAVVNTATADAIRRPSLCIGTTVEVQACIEAAVPSSEPPPDDDEGGCAAAPPWWPAALLPLVLRRRR